MTHEVEPRDGSIPLSLMREDYLSTLPINKQTVFSGITSIDQVNDQLRALPATRNLATYSAREPYHSTTCRA